MSQPSGASITQSAATAGARLQGNAGNISRSCPAVTLNIGVFFDGTGNNATNSAADGRSASFNNAPSNVALLTHL